MMRHRVGLWVFIAVAGVAAACMQTSRVGEDVTTATLSQSQKAVAVMRIGSASPTCLHAAVLLGQREGAGFRAKQVVSVADLRSVTESAVSEVELEPGEYHVVAYSCVQQKGPAVVGDKGASSQFYRSSLASFTVAPGEIVNVGYLHLEASHVGRNAFGRRIRTDVDITDWPLPELERYQARRPGLFAQMKTRLMTVTPKGPEPSDDECARLKALQADGKVQALPAKCSSAPAQPSPAAPRQSRAASAG